jgi:hypothetical protein
MIVIEHGDDDTEEATKFRHSSSLRAVRCREGYAFRGEKSHRPFGEVLSYEFWVLSCQAQYRDVREGRRAVWLVFLVYLVYLAR